MVTLARSQRTVILHYISNVICLFFISVIVEMQTNKPIYKKKQKQSHFVTRALKLCPDVIHHNGLLCLAEKTGPGRLVPVGRGFVQVYRWCWRMDTELRERQHLQTTMVAFSGLMSFCKMFVEMFICSAVSVLIFFS